MTDLDGDGDLDERLCGRIGSATGEACPEVRSAPRLAGNSAIVSVPDGDGGVINVHQDIAILVRYIVIVAKRDGHTFSMKHCDPRVLNVGSKCDYRTFDEQKKAASLGGFSATPGNSKHERGIALDVGCDGPARPSEHSVARHCDDMGFTRRLVG